MQLDTPEAKNFKRGTPRGLKADDLGKTVTIYGKPYIIAGLLYRGRETCIVLQATDGKRYNFAAESVAYALGRLEKWVDKAKSKTTDVTPPVHDVILPFGSTATTDVTLSESTYKKRFRSRKCR